jgi:archaellum component FlaG (FlaF/FlaG flagellin family)
MSAVILIVVPSILIIGAVVVGVITMQTLKKADDIKLTQGKLANSVDNINEAVKYLKITNE